MRHHTEQGRNHARIRTCHVQPPQPPLVSDGSRGNRRPGRLRGPHGLRAAKRREQRSVRIRSIRVRQLRVIGRARRRHANHQPSQAVWPVVEEVEVGAAGEGKIAFVAEPIAASDIVATHDVDVVVCGLGPAGDAAALACAEQGLTTVAVEKQTTGNYNSATIGGTNSKLHEHWGMTYDTDAWISDAMVDCAFQGDMELYRHWLEKNGEAVDWYISHFDNQNLDDYPLTFAAGDFPDFRDEWDKTALSRSWNTSLNLPYPPGELAGILAGILEAAGVEIRYSCPACQLVTDDAGKVTGVIVKSDAATSSTTAPRAWCSQPAATSSTSRCSRNAAGRAACRAAGSRALSATRATGTRWGLPWEPPRTNSRTPSCWTPSNSCRTCA